MLLRWLKVESLATSSLALWVYATVWCYEHKEIRTVLSPEIFLGSDEIRHGYPISFISINLNLLEVSCLEYLLDFFGFDHWKGFSEKPRFFDTKIDEVLPQLMGDFFVRTCPKV